MGQKHEPSDQSRAQVKALSGYGIPQEQIATLVGVKDSKTLRKHYKTEIAEGIAVANSNLGRSMYEQAVGRDAVYDAKGNLIRPALAPDKTAAIFLSKVRLGFKETTAVEHSGPDGKPIQTTPLDLSGLSTDELRQMKQLLAKAQARNASKTGS